MEPSILCLFLIVIPVADGAVPGTFFWKPRLGLDLAIPTTPVSNAVMLPTAGNVRDGLVVLIDGYQAGMTAVVLAAGVSSADTYPQMDPRSAYFYTTSYRWFLRHVSMLPFWLGGSKGTYCDTHKVWQKRFFYMDQFVPKWMRYIVPYIKDSEWKREEKEMRRYKKLAEGAFGRYYKYANTKFNNFRSMETKESIQDIEKSASSSVS